jgi:hypothetical protein
MKLTDKKNTDVNSYLLEEQKTISKNRKKNLFQEKNFSQK